jgi:regulator of protease activity HflC (stomatin/prohibitin superfamily)
MTVGLVVIAVVAVVALVVAAASIHILKQYERAVKFRRAGSVTVRSARV